MKPSTLARLSLLALALLAGAPDLAHANLPRANFARAPHRNAGAQFRRAPRQLRQAAPHRAPRRAPRRGIFGRLLGR